MEEANLKEPSTVWYQLYWHSEKLSPNYGDNKMVSDFQGLR